MQVAGPHLWYGYQNNKMHTCRHGGTLELQRQHCVKSWSREGQIALQFCVDCKDCAWAHEHCSSMRMNKKLAHTQDVNIPD